MTINSPAAVYVPAPDAGIRAVIDDGSGIVGTPFAEWWSARYGATDVHVPDRRTLIDYEGNRFGAHNMRTFADRVRHAHGRHVTGYPTVARASVRPAELVAVGTFYPEWRRVDVENAEQLVALSKWLALWSGDTFDSDKLHEELRCTDRVTGVGR